MVDSKVKFRILVSDTELYSELLAYLEGAEIKYEIEERRQALWRSRKTPVSRRLFEFIPIYECVI